MRSTVVQLSSVTKGPGPSVARAIQARRRLSRSTGRVWINGREVGGSDPRYAHLGHSHD